MMDQFEQFTEMTTRPGSGDERLLVKFLDHPLKNEEASIKEGRPIYEDKEFISIRFPGSRDEILREASAEDKARFPRHYALYKQGHGEKVIGTPLSLLPGATPSFVKEMEHFNVRTIEHLATLNDGVRINGIQDLKRKAQAYLDAAKGSAHVAKFEADLAQRDAEIATLKQQVQDLVAEVSKSRKGK